MAQLSPTVGVRETRKLEGAYRITGEDLARGTRFADGIVCCDNPVDDVMRASAAMTHDAAVAEGSYTIPFRALIPAEIENLMFCGGSCRRMRWPSPRFGACRSAWQWGRRQGRRELAIDAGCAVQQVDTGALVADLSAQGVRGLGNAELVAA